MLSRLLVTATLVLAFATAVFAQNTDSSAARGGEGTRPRTAATSAARPQDSATPTPTPAPRRAAGRSNAQTAAETAALRGVRAAFDALIEGIRQADADAVMGVYWNSPQLILFNNNGTVTKSWTQVRENRQSLYAKVSDVKLEVRDLNVRLLGPGAAVASCMWEQSQTASGQPERATGRLTIVFQRVSGEWKAVHAHTSPDRPDPSRLLPSERTTDAPAATPTPVKP